MTLDQSPFGSRDPKPFDDLLIDLYLQKGRPVDELAYTNEFDMIYDALKCQGDTRTKSEVFRRLLNLRKAGQLPRVA
jgi:hypothetical protein